MPLPQEVNPSIGGATAHKELASQAFFSHRRPLARVYVKAESIATKGVDGTIQCCDAEVVPEGRKRWVLLPRKRGGDTQLKASGLETEAGYEDKAPTASGVLGSFPRGINHTLVLPREETEASPGPCYVFPWTFRV